MCQVIALLAHPLPGLNQAVDPACPTPVARVVGGPIVVHRHCRSNPTSENQPVILAADPSQANGCHLAERALTATLLSAEGAASAIDPFKGLGAWAVRVRLFLTRRKQPVHKLELNAGLTTTLH